MLRKNGQSSLIKLLKTSGLLVAFLVLTGTAELRAQVTTATLYGTVQDSSGAPISGASVKAVNEASGSVFTATTDGTGEFTLTFLPVGRYDLIIAASGFKEQTQEKVELTAGQRLRLSFGMVVGQLSEKVTVTAELSTLQNVSPEQLVTHSTVQVRELPLARRDWTNLINNGPGLQVRGAGGGTGVVMNGLAPGAAALTVDGTQASGSAEENSLTAFGNFNLIRVVSLEAISEVNVSKGISSAEFVNTLSGNVGLITKSGGNEFHGSLFENYQGRVLNARNQFLSTRPPEVFNQFGGSIGGPVINPELLRTAIAWTRFPPHGVRGFGITASQISYQSAKMVEIMEHANRETMNVVQFESIEALQRIDDLLSIDGIDVAMIGPADLSISMGVPGEFDHPDLVASIEKFITDCERHGVVPGIHCRSIEMAKPWIAKGMRLVGCGSEITMLIERAQSMISELRVAQRESGGKHHR